MKIIDKVCYGVAEYYKDRLNKFGRSNFNIDLVKNFYDYEITQLPVSYYPILTVYRRDEYIDSIFAGKSDLSIVIKYGMVYPTIQSVNSLNHLIANEIRYNLKFLKTEKNIFVADDRAIRIVYPPAQLYENQAILTTLEIYLTIEAGSFDNL